MSSREKPFEPKWKSIAVVENPEKASEHERLLAILFNLGEEEIRASHQLVVLTETTKFTRDDFALEASQNKKIQ